MGQGEAVDVAIVGSGMAGTLAALALAREGCRVTLFDAQAEPQPEFRAEQVVGLPLVRRLEALGALTSIVGNHAFEPITYDTCLGRVIGRTHVPQLGLPYHQMVAGARAALPASVRTVFGRVTGLEPAGDGHVVVMADGTRTAARLLVVATGLASVLLKRLGLSYRMVRRDQCVALGFDIELEPGRAMPPPLVQHPDSTRDRVDYLALFPMDGVLRANLFSYRDIGSPWVRDFCREPGPMLEACMPALGRLLGPYRVIEPIQTRTNDLRVLDAPVRDGVVVIGDAFQSPCPALGTGLSRLVNDVEALARHAPGWLTTPGMGRDKIVQYYGDPIKCAYDAKMLRMAQYRRALQTEQSVWWAFNRARAALRTRAKRAVVELAHLRSLRRLKKAPAFPVSRREVSLPSSP